MLRFRRGTMTQNGLFSSQKLPFLLFVIGIFIFMCYIFFVGLPFASLEDNVITSESNVQPSGNKQSHISLKELLSACVSIAENGGHAVYNIRTESNDLHQKSKGETREGADDPLTDGDMKSHNQMYYGLKKLYPDLNIISEEHGKEPDATEVIGKADPGREDVLHDALISDIKVPVEDVTVWIDPLDATKEYTENLVQYVTTMACVAVKGVPVIGVIHKPFTNTTIWAWVGKSKSDSLINLVGKKKLADDVNKKIIVSRSHAGKVQNVSKTAFGEDTIIVPAGGAGFKALEVVSGSVDAYVHTTLIKKWDICAGDAILRAIGGRMTTLDGNYITYDANTNIKNEGGLIATMSNHDFIVQKLRGKFK